TMSGCKNHEKWSGSCESCKPCDVTSSCKRLASSRSSRWIRSTTNFLLPRSFFVSDSLTLSGSFSRSVSSPLMRSLPMTATFFNLLVVSSTQNSPQSILPPVSWALKRNHPTTRARTITHKKLPPIPGGGRRRDRFGGGELLEFGEGSEGMRGPLCVS